MVVIQVGGQPVVLGGQATGINLSEGDEMKACRRPVIVY